MNHHLALLLSKLEAYTPQELRIFGYITIQRIVNQFFIRRPPMVFANTMGGLHMKINFSYVDPPWYWRIPWGSTYENQFFIHRPPMVLANTMGGLRMKKLGT